ncbi:hypothetical protein O6H91_14G065500 [Diphasiastrum complanatum]|uniref:Uncharacterized protein n=1 Tax=Diphasiastrum complanatum TaxID=34168 RepID=A0ACC2BQZ4_DIPCM|nr:hypothetical protein O6H91_14G065500 [Diphasiastrum complanatum]
MIEIILVDDTTNQFVTAGFDGYVRFWNFEWLDAAADGDEKLICEINPLRELQVEQNCQIKGFLFQTDHWIIQDEGGALWKVNIASFELEQLLEFHAGAIAATACSPNSYYFATAGSDGTVRLYHFKQHKQIYYRRFSSGATAMIWLSLVVDPKGITIAIGFRDGVLRVLQQSSSKWRLVHASKPHTMDVVALCTSPNGELLATASMDATIFFFECSRFYKPRGFVKMDGPITCMDWSPNGNQLLVGCKNGAIFEVACPV